MSLRGNALAAAIAAGMSDGSNPTGGVLLADKVWDEHLRTKSPQYIAYFLTRVMAFVTATEGPEAAGRMFDAVRTGIDALAIAKKKD